MSKLLLAAWFMILSSCSSAGSQNDREALVKALIPRMGSFTWHVPEKLPDGKENRQCFTVPHHGLVLYWPSHHTVSFTLTQSARPKTSTAVFSPAGAHQVMFQWDQTSETVAVFVDGKPAQKLEVGQASVDLNCPF